MFVCLCASVSQCLLVPAFLCGLSPLCALLAPSLPLKYDSPINA
jgi:hypothetical protein